MAEQFLTMMADLDDEAQALLSGWYHSLQEAGFVGVQTPGLPYHISLSTFPLEQEKEAAEIAEKAAASFEPVPVHFSHIGMFAGGKILFAAPEKNAELAALQEACRSRGPQQYPWTPHTTILIDESETIHAALPVFVKSFVPFVAKVKRLHLCAFWPTREIGSFELGGQAVPVTQQNPSAIHLETERLILRDYTESDFEAYYKLKTDDQTMYYMQDLRPKSRDAAKADFRDILDDMKQPNRKYCFLHMELKDTHEQVGSIGYTVTDENPAGKMVHLGYFTYPGFWGNGYTSEALKKVLEYAFTADHVYRVTTGCLAENIGSERVMQKNGMIREAEHLDYEWHDGKMKTRLEYRLLKNEWADGRSASGELL